MLTKKEASKNEAKNTKTAKAQAQSTPDSAATSRAPTAKNSTTKTQEQTDQRQTHPYGQHASQQEPNKKGQKTRITVKYDCGFGNQLYIRGKGANLNWDRGQPLKNVKPDEWAWETEQPFSQCEFKILVNDRHFENGDNHYITNGATIVFTPQFA